MTNETEILHYATAYTVSNEDQRWATAVFPNAKRILTVAASGDQALFYHLNGATHIDTFDITHFAHGIQDIKTTAIKMLTYEEYIKLLLDLNRSYDNEMQIRNMDKIAQQMPRDSATLLTTPAPMMGRFNAGIASLKHKEQFPTKDEYARLQATINQPFPFVHSALHDLHKNVSGGYDIINTSNIFDKGYEAAEQSQIMVNLLPKLSVGGRFLYLPQLQQFDYSKIKYTAPDTGMRLEYEATINHPTDRWSKIISLQRTR